LRAAHGAARHAHGAPDVARPARRPQPDSFLSPAADARACACEQRHESFTAMLHPVRVSAGSFIDIVKSAVRVWRVLENRWTRHRGRACVALLICAFVAPVRGADPYAFLGREAPDFALHALTGGNVRLSEHRGDVVVVTFWGSRCNVCRAPLAALDGLFTTYQSAGLVAVGVGVDDNAAASREFAQSVRVRFPMLMDPTKGVARDWQVDSLPMTVFIDRSGKVRAVTRDVGRNAEAVYRREIRPLLDE